MLRPGHIAFAARVAAAAVAVAISGAPAVLAMSAPPERHACSCATHAPGRECPCALCQRASPASARATGPARPSCHPVQAPSGPAERVRRPLAGAASLVGTCGGPAAAAMTPAGLEPFVLPAATMPSPCASAHGVAHVRARPSLRTIEPETPPPRAARSAASLRADPRLAE